MYWNEGPGYLARTATARPRRKVVSRPLCPQQQPARRARHPRKILPNLPCLGSVSLCPIVETIGAEQDSKLRVEAKQSQTAKSPDDTHKPANSMRGMSLILFVSALFGLCIGSSEVCGSTSCSGSACPSDDPFTTEYGSRAVYPWAFGMVNWSCVYSLRDFAHGSTADRLEAALAAASNASGGGVVYVPAGKYQLDRTVQVPSNVAIRGDPTHDRAKHGKEPGSLSPKTLFECPDR